MLDWLWACHFKGDPVMPGCLALDALWQLTGFFLGWLGAPGKGRALGVGEVKFTGMVIPSTKTVQYVVDLKRVILRKLKLAIADEDEGGPAGDLCRHRPARRPVRGRRTTRGRMRRRQRAPQRGAAAALARISGEAAGGGKERVARCDAWW